MIKVGASILLLCIFLAFVCDIAIKFFPNIPYYSALEWGRNILMLVFVVGLMVFYLVIPKEELNKPVFPPQESVE